MTLTFIAPEGVDFSQRAVRQVRTSLFPAVSSNLTRLHLLQQGLAFAQLNQISAAPADIVSERNGVTFDAVSATAVTRGDGLRVRDVPIDYINGFTFGIITNGPDAVTADFLTSLDWSSGSSGVRLMINADRRRIQWQVNDSAGVANVERFRATGFWPSSDPVLVFFGYNPGTNQAFIYTPDDDDMRTATLGGSSNPGNSASDIFLLGRDSGAPETATVASANAFLAYDGPMTAATMLEDYNVLKPWLAEQGLEIL